MTSNDEMVTLLSRDQVKIKFDPNDCSSWKIFDYESGERIASLAVNDEGLFVEADIQLEYQRKGIATAVIRYLVEQCGMEFYFWVPDGNTYEDARNLSIEGAALANSVIQKGLAKWFGNEERQYNEDH